MADFVAVIRRAVDGLTDNSPDMRGKVYDKARGAVRRQLEAMNPRPSDELVQRQLDKLEKAITEVESEHAEALPAEEAAIEETVPVAIESPEVPEPPETVQPPLQPVVEPAPSEPRAMAEPATVSYVSVEEQEPPITEPAPAFRPEQPEPAVQHWADEAASLPQDVVPAQDETAHPDAAVEAQDQSPAFIGLQPVDEPANDHTAFAEQAAGPLPSEPINDAPAAAAAPDAAGSVAPGMAGGAPAAMAWEWSEVSADTVPDAVTAHEAVAREERAQDFASAEVPAEPPAEWKWPEEATTGELKTEQKNARDNAWGDLEDLIGYQPGKGGGATAATAPDAGPAGVTEAVRNGQRPFRAEPRKRKISFAAIGAAVAAVVVVGGAGAAYWLNRDTVDQVIGDLVAPAATPSGGVADGGSGVAATGDQNQSETAGTQVASVETGKSKFTQRLLADGTEIDEGPAVVAGEITTEEGKSVAEQTTEVASAGATAPAGANGAATATGGGSDAGPAAGGVPASDTSGQVAAGTPGTPTAPGTTQTAATAGATQQPPVGVSQKMFLYEERLGQSAPTAIDGTVVWSKGEESPGGDAKPEPVIHAQVNVPSNGLTAQLTLRRNADKSLPASHLVEIVFALPAEFEGGNIDSVQRVAMKQTEQDRGDPLIAVPAKITEDFHMIALNDFPDAIARNTELLKSRDWIDIPITYRNGRRALITLEKGTTGAEVFNSVMNAWSALGPTANSQ